MPEINNQNSNKPNISANKKAKPSLGRGLGSLLGGGLEATQNLAPISSAVEPIPVKTEPVVKIAEEAQIWNIQIDRLTPNTQQPRKTFTPEALRDLAASIKEKGILQPITARRLNERQFEIIAGERRWRAAQVAGLHEVPVILKKVSEQDSLEYAIIENIQRENLNPMEESEAYHHLMTDYGLTQQQVADKLGKERSSVANTLRLMVLPVEIKAMVRKNLISTGHAKVLLSIEQSANQIALAQRIIDDKLSVRAAELAAVKLKQNTDESPAKGPGGPPSGDSLDLNVSQRLIQGLATELQKLVGTKVTIDYADKKGKLQIHFYSDEQLSDLVEKIRKSCQK